MIRKRKTILSEREKRNSKRAVRGVERGRTDPAAVKTEARAEKREQKADSPIAQLVRALH